MKRKIQKWLAVSAAVAICTTGTFSGYAADDIELSIWDVTASSVLPASDYGNYDPWNLQDRDWSTAWVENVPGYGKGESVTITLPDDVIVTGAYIVNGYCKSESLFYKNSAPLSLKCQVGNKACTIDLSSTASDYQAAASGYRFDFPSEIEAKTITFTIGDVRAGTHYEDTCISELYVLGYYSSQGGSETEVVLPDGITEEALYFMEGEAYWIFRRTANDSFACVNVEADQLSKEDRAFLTYWYQYHGYGDSRIQPAMEYNEVSNYDLHNIMTEMFGSCTEDEFDEVWTSYGIEYDSDRILMNGSGDFGDAGPVIFTNSQASVEQGKLRLEGTVMSYNQDIGDYEPVTNYTAWFAEEQAEASAIHRFLSLQVGDASIQVPAMGEKGLFSIDELRTMALDYYEKENEYRPGECDAMEDSDGKVILHLYTIEGDHTATSAWYEVDYNGEGTDTIFGTEIDLKQ